MRCAPSSGSLAGRDDVLKSMIDIAVACAVCDDRLRGASVGNSLELQAPGCSLHWGS